MANYPLPAMPIPVECWYGHEVTDEMLRRWRSIARIKVAGSPPARLIILKPDEIRNQREWLLLQKDMPKVFTTLE